MISFLAVSVLSFVTLYLGCYIAQRLDQRSRTIQVLAESKRFRP